MPSTATWLQDVRRLVTDDGFALSVLAAVGGVTVLTFGLGATLEIVVAVLVVGVMTALAERSLRARG